MRITNLFGRVGSKVQCANARVKTCNGNRALLRLVSTLCPDECAEGVQKPYSQTIEEQDPGNRLRVYRKGFTSQNQGTYFFCFCEELIKGSRLCLPRYVVKVACPVSIANDCSSEKATSMSCSIVL